MIEYYVLYERIGICTLNSQYCLFISCKQKKNVVILGLSVRAMLNSICKLDFLTFLCMRQVAIKLMKLRMLLVWNSNIFFSKLKVDRVIKINNWRKHWTETGHFRILQPVIFFPFLGLLTLSKINKSAGDGLHLCTIQLWSICEFCLINLKWD